MLTFKKFPAWITPDGNKVPIIKDWQTLATDDKTQLDTWFRKYGGPNFLWGIPTGKVNNIYVLDVDMKKGKNGQASLAATGGVVPNTAWQETRSGGYHLLFRPNGQTLGNSVNFLDGLDIRGEGGWIADYGIEKNATPIADFPSWLYGYVNTKHNQRDVISGENIRIPTTMATALVAELCRRIESAPDGQGNNELNAAAFEAGQILASAPKINEEWLYEQLMKAATKNGRRSERESRATIESGLHSGRNNPQLIDTEGFKNLKTEYSKPETPESRDLDLWIPSEFKLEELNNTKALRKPQLFEDWLSEDICLFNASGGTGKTTLKLYEAICMRLGDTFLGFNCKTAGAKTLFITGEDSEQKLKAMIGQILKHNGITDKQKIKEIISGIYIKKDTDMQIVTKGTNGWTYNQQALDTVANAIQKLGVKKVVFDPLSIFWGSEQQVNDMTRGVVKFATKVVEYAPVCLEFVHHLNVDNSKTKDMSQFAGRGGSVIPSHSRIVTTMRGMDDEDIQDFGIKLVGDESGILCNVGKFSDGSKLLNKPFVIVRDGYKFRREDVKMNVQSKGKKTQGVLPEEELINWIKSEREAKRYPSKAIIENHFGANMGKTAAKQALKNLEYLGFKELRIKKIDNPVGESREQVYVVIDKEGNEL